MAEESQISLEEIAKLVGDLPLEGISELLIFPTKIGNKSCVSIYVADGKGNQGYAWKQGDSKAEYKPLAPEEYRRGKRGAEPISTPRGY